MATDNGDPAQTTSVTVQININDINEFDPQFSQSLYNVSGLAFNDTLPGVCMCVYTWVCVNMCLFVCMCMHACVCVHVCVCVHCVCAHMCLYVCVNIYVRVLCCVYVSM